MASVLHRVRFAHNAEAEFAALLDFYEVRWAYEPRTFVLAEGPDGCPTQAFTPDFYLPDFDRYIEITTLDQRLVTRKNRKVRLLRELVPGIDVQILYRRDYQELLVKYGLAAPEQAGDSRTRSRAAEASGLLAVGPLRSQAASASPISAA